MSMYMCKAHGGYGFVADCVECKAIAAAASLGGGEFTTEGAKRVADKMRDDGQPVLASALMDLAEQRDTLRAQLAEGDAECNRLNAAVQKWAERTHAAEEKLAASDARVVVLEKSLRHYGTHSDHCEKSRFVNPSVCTCGYDAALSAGEQK